MRLGSSRTVESLFNPLRAISHVNFKRSPEGMNDVTRHTTVLGRNLGNIQKLICFGAAPSVFCLPQPVNRKQTSSRSFYDARRSQSIMARRSDLSVSHPFIGTPSHRVRLRLDFRTRILVETN